MKKILSVCLLLAMLLGLLASCVGGNGGTTPTAEPTTPPTGGDDSTPPPVVDSWVDVWDQDPTFTPITNDKALDSNGIQANGSWFDSFKSDKSLFWKTNGESFMSFSDGQMNLKSPSPDAYFDVSRGTNGADHFEAEIRMKMDYFGNSNAIYAVYGGQRAAVYLFESKVRVTQDSTRDNYPRGEFIYTEIGYDWHTYLFRVNGDICELYIDGVFLASFLAEPAGATNCIGFFGVAVDDFTTSRCTVEYVSYTVTESKKLEVTSPKASSVAGKGVTDVTVTGEVKKSLAAENDEVAFYLNGAYAGTAPTDACTMTFEDLTPGVYSVFLTCGGETSGETVFFIEEDDAGAASDPVYSTNAKLQSSYILNFSVNGNGSVTAGDGYFPLDLQFNSGKLTYRGLDGEKTVDTGNGDYIAVVDGGVAWIYYDGRMIGSYRMPYGACDTKVKTEGGVQNMKMQPYSATLYQTKFEGAAQLDTDPGKIPYNYAVEFEYTYGNDLTVSLSEGAYFMDLRFTEGGDVIGVMAPHQLAYEQVFCKAKEGTHLYRVAVFNGIGQLFVDNVWVASWKLSRTVSPRNVFVKGSGIGMFRITETNDRFYLNIENGDADWDDYFNVKMTAAPAGDARALKVYSKDTKVSAVLDLKSNTTGQFYLVAKYFNGTSNVHHSGVIAGYDYAKGQFVIGGTYEDLAATSNTKIPTSGKVTLTLVVEGSTAKLYCNDSVVATYTTTLNGWGNVGYVNNLTNATFTSFSYEGDGNPLYDAATTMIKDKHTVCIYELNGKTYISEESGYMYVSNDGGENFSALSTSPYASYNCIVLQSGKILSLKRNTSTPAAKYYEAYLLTISGNRVLKQEGPFRVNSDANSYRFTMNGKVIQAANGRIVFVSGETENENIGMLWVYYSDDDGRTWVQSPSIFNHSTTGMNLQEGVAVDMGNNYMRMYARNDGGFLVYSESFDNGATWSMDLKYSNFASVVSAFNINRDPENGAIYVCWEYNGINDSCTIQFPRTRMGMAVSFNNGETWEYVGDMDELNSMNFMTFGHWNIGMWVTSDAVFATAGKQVGSTWYNYTVKVNKDTIVPSARFNGLHGPFRDPTTDTEGIQLWTNSVLAISKTSKRVFASGTYYDIAEVNGKKTMVTADMIASFLNGTLTVSGDVATIKIGNASYSFTAGSKIALINGEEKEMTFEAVASNGSVSVSIEDLDTLLGLTTRCTEHGAIVITVDPAPIRLEYILAQVGIW